VLVVLIRTTLLALNQAVQTGNFTVLRDLGSPDLQVANSSAKLGIIFADLRNRNIDLSPVAIVAPEVSEPPTITPQNMLRLVGFFPTQLLQIKFQMLFQPVNGQWRLFGMAVDAVSPPTAPAATVQESPPASKVSAPTAASPVVRPATTPKPTEGDEVILDVTPPTTGSKYTEFTARVQTHGYVFLSATFGSQSWTASGSP
jgi:hypothetical protein